MSEREERDERPCLHCMMVELIDDFFAEYPTAGSAKVDTAESDEVIDAIAKTVAERGHLGMQRGPFKNTEDPKMGLTFCLTV